MNAVVATPRKRTKPTEVPPADPPPADPGWVRRPGFEQIIAYFVSCQKELSDITSARKAGGWPGFEQIIAYFVSCQKELSDITSVRKAGGGWGSNKSMSNGARLGWT